MSRDRRDDPPTSIPAIVMSIRGWSAVITQGPVTWTVDTVFAPHPNDTCLPRNAPVPALAV
ncbi:MAG: hypothetical protein M9950_01015 [Thermomicrobiales bacterium]|nr:hypothetical protein [Thermomicrobiales bacterium]